MAFITLTTDWQTGDYYSGMMKGRLLRLIPDAVIVEINQNIEPFHILQGSFVLRQALPEYPDGTIHLFFVNQGHQPGIWPAVAGYKKQYLVGWDDGVLALVMDSDPDFYLSLNHTILHNMDQATGLAEPYRFIEPSFPELSLFSRIARYLASGIPVNQAGPLSGDYIGSNPWLPVISKDQIDGQVVYIDSYSNAVTNIPKDEFLRIGNRRNFEITIKSNRHKIHRISTTYLEADPGELLAIFNSSRLLEIAVVQGSASELIGFEQGTPIKVRFNES